MKNVCNHIHTIAHFFHFLNGSARGADFDNTATVQMTRCQESFQKFIKISKTSIECGFQTAWFRWVTTTFVVVGQTDPISIGDCASLEHVIEDCEHLI